jgi:exopolysaccharide biosynthesis operon protein EpsL
LLAALASTAASATTRDDQFVRWPGDGYFPAYPAVETEQKLLFYAKADAVYDDNLFRLSDDYITPVLGVDDRDERYAKPGIGLRVATEASRQQFAFNANAEYYLFDRFTELNRWVYAADAAWKWAVGDRLRGDLAYAQSLRLPDFAELQFASEDAIQQKAGHASATIKILSRVELRGLIEETRFDHADETQAALDNTVDAGTLGLVYVSQKNLTTGVQYKRTRGDYPNRQTVGANVVDNRYRENEASFILIKTFDEPGNFDVRVGHTERKHEEVPERDFDGVTGRLQWRYAMSAKVMLDFAAYRELQAVEEISASYADVKGGAIGPAWAPTEKTVLQAYYVDEKRNFGGDPGFVLTNTPPREDHSRSVRLAAGYQPSEHFRIGISYERGTRDSNVLYADYEYNLIVLRIVGSL